MIADDRPIGMGRLTEMGTNWTIVAPIAPPQPGDFHTDPALRE